MGRLATIYYGWPMLVAVSTAQVVSWGILYYAFSVFVAPMQAELGWSLVELSGAYGLSLLMAGVAAVPVGRWIDRHGTRLLMTVGSSLAVLLVVAWSQVSDLFTFYLIMAGVGLVCAAVLYEPAFALIAVWFRHRRGQAFTVLTFFGAFASFIFIPLSAWLVSLFGWRNALLVLAGLLASITIPLHALFLRHRPADLGLLPDGEPQPLADNASPQQPEPAIPVATVLREQRFWLLTFAFAVSLFATVVMTVHSIPYLVQAGHSTGFAATIAGLFGLMSLLGRITIGPLADRYPRTWITSGLIGMQLIGLGVLIVAGEAVAGSLLYIILFGAGSGTLTMMRAALLAEYYGATHYGTINGVQNMALTWARAAAPVGVGVLVSALGSYQLVLWGLIVLLLFAAIAVVLNRQPAHYMYQNHGSSQAVHNKQ
jgi:MFS family permease